MTTKDTLSPRRAKNIDDLCKMVSDNFDADDHWILTDTYNVDIAQQAIGELPRQSINIPRKTFDKLVDWYMREQKLKALALTE